ncbi:MAG: transglutaminase [Alphaproteobacteria bacterium]|nr:MAG: transglutaminase [Alphaproteobacteria bacterium]
MTLRQKLLRLGSPARVAVFAILILIGVWALPPTAYADDPKAVSEAPGNSQPIRTSAQPPAKFFTINGVLAKLDRAEGRGKGAIRLASLKSWNAMMDARPPTGVSARGTEPFGLFTFRAPEGLLSRKWRGLQSDIIKEQKVLERCRADASDCPSYAAQFLRLINAVKSKSGRAQLEEANRGVNASIRFVTDYAQYGEADRWSAPLATFATAKGDCEDYAFAKYVALRAAGFPSDDLRVVMGRDRTIRQDHAVLAARLDGRWLILDSQRSELIEDSRVPDLTPVFAIDHRGVLLLAANYE